MSAPAQQGSKSSRNSQKSSATLQSTKSKKSTKSDTSSNASRVCKASTSTKSSRSPSTPPYASTSHNEPSAQLITYLADPTHSNPGYAYTHTDAFTHIYGFPHDPIVRWDLEDEMILEAEARAQRELEEFERMTRDAEAEADDE